MEDLIKRSDATEAVYKALRTPPLKGVLTDTMSLAIALVRDIPSADRPQEWISCSERMPKEDGFYLATITDGEQIAVCKMPFLESEWRGNCFDDEVLAWMPLPKPWKGDRP